MGSVAEAGFFGTVANIDVNRGEKPLPHVFYWHRESGVSPRLRITYAGTPE